MAAAGTRCLFMRETRGRRLVLLMLLLLICGEARGGLAVGPSVEKVRTLKEYFAACTLRMYRCIHARFIIHTLFAMMIAHSN